MRKIPLTIYLFAALLAQALTVGASTGAQVLEKNVSPRAEAMGEAYLAVADDAYAIYRNPAGLTYLRQSQFGGTYSTGLMDDSWGQVSYANAGNACHTWGLGLMTYDGGNFDLVDYFGNSSRYKAESDWLLTLAGAYRFSENFRLGLAIELLHSTLLENYNATTGALNMGASINLAQTLRLDTAVRHLGPPIRYAYHDAWGAPFQGGYQEWDALPLSLEAGLAWEILEPWAGKIGQDLVVAASWLAMLDSLPRWNFGIEYWVLSRFALRGGYQLNRNLQTWSVGAGAKFDATSTSQVQLDYAYIMNQEFNQVHKLAMTFLFKENQERLAGARVLTLEPARSYLLSLLKVSAGSGRIYGGLGGNAEIMWGDYFALFGGLGSYSPLDAEKGIGWAAGCRTYLGFPTQGFRGRFSVFLSNGFWDAKVRQALTDYSGTFGFQWRLAEPISLDLDAGGGVPLTIPNRAYYTLNAGLTAHIPKGEMKINAPRKNFAAEKKNLSGALDYITNIAILKIPEAQVFPLVTLEKIKIAKYETGLYEIRGSVANYSSNDLDKVELAIVYFDAAGNSLNTEYFLPVDLASDFESRAQPLKAGFIRNFRFRPASLPINYTHAAVGIKTVQEIIPAGKADLAETPGSGMLAKWGFGYGWPYGLVGTNAELMLADFIGLQAGIGSINAIYNYNELAWQTGVRLYLLPADHKFRLRVGVAYGTARVVEPRMPGLGCQLISGVHLSSGFQWRFAQSLSFDWDLIYVMPTQAASEIESYRSVDYNSGDPLTTALGFTIHLGNTGKKRNQCLDQKIEK